MAFDTYCTFYIGDFFFGIPVTLVQEVSRHQTVTPVPLAPSQFRGLINLRGQILTALALRERLQLAQEAEADHGMNVILRTRQQTVSLVVDRIGDVVGAETDDMEHPPETVPASVRRMISRVCKLPDKLLLILDVDRVLDYTDGAGEVFA